MMMRRIATLTLCLLLMLASAGCFFRKKKPAAPPAVPPPKPELPTVQPAPPPPKIETGATPPGAPPSVSTKMPESPKPPPQKKVVRRPKRVNAKKSDKPSPDPGALPSGAETGAPAGPPRLGELVPESQRADLIRQCDQAMAAARVSLSKIPAKKLDKSQTDAADRVRALLLQAEAAKMRDPQTALQLAQRAEVLAGDLVKTIP